MQEYKISVNKKCGKVPKEWELPINHIYRNWTNPTNPAILLGYGVWEIIIVEPAGVPNSTTGYCHKRVA